MKENVKLEMAKAAEAVRSSILTSELDEGIYDYLLNINTREIIKRFNSGDYSILDSDECSLFVNTKISSNQIVSVILSLKNLLKYKNDFLRLVEEKKTNMTYNHDEYIDTAYRRYYDRYETKITYANIEKAFEIAERIMSNDKIYRILNFLLKNEALIPQLQERQKLFDLLLNNVDGTKSLLELIQTNDNDIGIITVDSSDNGRKVVVGTKKDMAISDILGYPFEANKDEPGYDYGPYGDYWMPPKKVVKTFYGDGETATHKKMIEEERQRRSTLSRYGGNECGYIMNKGVALLITRSELIKNGIDPARVGWKPLALKPEVRTIFSKELPKQMSIRERLSLGKSLILK